MYLSHKECICNQCPHKVIYCWATHTPSETALDKLMSPFIYFAYDFIQETTQLTKQVSGPCSSAQW